MAVTSESLNMPSSGWSSHLYWLWILYNSAAFVVVLTAVAVLGWIGADVLQLSWEDRGRVAALLVATLGALLFGGVLGALQWLIVRQRVPVPRNRWIVANVGPALVGWLFVIIPAVASAEESGTSVSGAYLLAASQTLALGPLLGLSQALGAAVLHSPLGLVDRCQRGVLVPRRRTVLRVVVALRGARPHSARRFRRPGVPDAHRHHSFDRSCTAVGAGPQGPRPTANTDGGAGPAETGVTASQAYPLIGTSGSLILRSTTREVGPRPTPAAVLRRSSSSQCGGSRILASSSSSHVG